MLNILMMRLRDVTVAIAPVLDVDWVTVLAVVGGAAVLVVKPLLDGALSEVGRKVTSDLARRRKRKRKTQGRRRK